MQRASSLGWSEIDAGPRVDGIEHRHAQVLGDRQAGERPRQLEAAGDAAAGALVGQQTVDRFAVEARRCRLSLVQRAADAVDQGALAGAVRADQADALALRDVEA